MNNLSIGPQRLTVLAVMFALPGAVFAAPITVGGITWDPDFPTDFNGTTGQIEQVTIDDPNDPPGPPQIRQIFGVGEISTINGSSAFDFCASGSCELTFEFGYTYEFPNDLGGTESQASIIATNGFFNIYFDSTPDYTQGAPGATPNALNGDLWLTLAGADSTVNSYTGAVGDNRVGNLGQLFFDGEEFTDTTPGTIDLPLLPASGMGLFDVSDTGLVNSIYQLVAAGTIDAATAAALSIDSGVQARASGDSDLAGANFDTNTLTQFSSGSWTIVPNSAADLSFASDFSTAVGGTGDLLQGSADFRGDSVSVPLPGTLALLGAGLFGIGFGVRRTRRL